MANAMSFWDQYAAGWGTAKQSVPVLPECRVEWDGEVLFALEAPKRKSLWDSNAIFTKLYTAGMRQLLNEADPLAAWLRGNQR